MEISLIADSISAVCVSKRSTNAVAPPPRKSIHLRTARRSLVRKRRRTRRRSDSGGEYDGFYGDSGDGSGFNGGGRGWNSGGGSFGWSNWEWEGTPYPDDPAFDFVYEVLCWIALSNCLHFAFKKVVSGGDSEREKLRMIPIC